MLEGHAFCPAFMALGEAVSNFRVAVAAGMAQPGRWATRIVAKSLEYRLMAISGLTLKKVFLTPKI